MSICLIVKYINNCDQIYNIMSLYKIVITDVTHKEYLKCWNHLGLFDVYHTLGSIE